MFPPPRNNLVIYLCTFSSAVSQVLSVGLNCICNMIGSLTLGSLTYVICVWQCFNCVIVNIDSYLANSVIYFSYHV